MKIKKNISTRAVVIALLSDAETFLSIIIQEEADKYGHFEEARDRVEILETIFYCDDMREASEQLKEIWRDMVGWVKKYANIVEASKSAFQKIKDAKYAILDELNK